MSTRDLSSFGVYASLMLISLAWLYPSSSISVFLGWIASILICLSISHVKKPYRVFFTAGIIMHIIGFHWLFFTIRDFGGFGNFGALSVFTVFALGSSLQLIIFIFLWRNLPKTAHNLNLAVALAWATSEILSIRIFPWHLGHTQLSFVTFAQVSDISGAIGITALMLYLSDTLVAIFNKGFKPNNIIAPLLLIASLYYGSYRIEQFNNATFKEQDVALVQGNISLQEKHNVKMFQVNAQRYKEITTKLARPGLLVIWPETVITEWIFANLQSVSDDPKSRLPNIPGIALLIGSLTFQSEKLLHNSAIAIQPNGYMERPYHKQILMPFGEYTPLGDYLPWLRELNNTVGDFTAGDGVKVFDFNISNNLNTNHTLKVAPLICYEDVMTRLAREATLQGAEVLVNITNDAWFGDTVAPYQHNLIASFRAIENRRYLLRSTNSGMTAIINPIGQIEGELPTYSEGVLEAKIKIKNLNSPFVSYLGDKPWLIIGILTIITAFLTRLVDPYSSRRI